MSEVKAVRRVYAIHSDEVANLPEQARRWAQATGFKAASGSVLLVPDASGKVSEAVLGLGGRADSAPASSLQTGALVEHLPAGQWQLAPGALDADLAELGFLMGGYRFDRYRSKAKPAERPVLEVEGASGQAKLLFGGISLTRDLINTPANDMGPEAIEQAVRNMAATSGGTVSVIAGDALLEQNFPMIHAVGRAGPQAPRLIDLTFGPEDAPRVTLVGKGVAFDTGGLDIKPASGMLLMKKDMGGAANVLGLAKILMEQNSAIRLRVLVPAVENSIASNAFRPGDVLTSRAGKTVEIGNTDAEGRLILADALAVADEESPELLVDMATLTGAARVALGPDLPPMYTSDDQLAGELAAAAHDLADPLWRMPLWKPYAANLSSRIADMNNVTPDGFAGSITAALFLESFVERAKSWVHFDVFGWRAKTVPYGGIGGEAQCIRALHAVITRRYGHAG
ncbi:leucyl aminopeptidase family protein [Aureimonas fodinaquatilis]|uniref:Leucyl aminopeptidase family protein n=1 Tax=Aureimonas fodinaquatilis TaxID=2565783 RepID=A0A5B0E154_9HYPH|nr:leucyl aminopeptidase family protein [Aureimonas fodinaquatilis]KAA0972032.1 leucyl aminopeptidase family protein [Aureimonas fodinaquatilis]